MHTMNVTGFVFTIQPLQTEILRQGDTIGFEVTVTCDKKRVTADEIYISLMRTVMVHSSGSSGMSTRHRNHDKKVLASNITMDPGESCSFEFVTKLPDDCGLSDGESANLSKRWTEGWCLYIHVENDEYRASGSGKATAWIKKLLGGIDRFMAAIGELVGNDRIGAGIGDKIEGRVLRPWHTSCFFLTVKKRRGG